MGNVNGALATLDDNIEALCTGIAELVAIQEIDENAPDIGAGAYPVLFGNFMRSYYIVRRTARRLVRDPYTSKPYVNFYTTERVGGDVVNSQCIKLLKVKAA